jgi:hypothetical protein
MVDLSIYRQQTAPSAPVQQDASSGSLLQNNQMAELGSAIGGSIDQMLGIDDATLQKLQQQKEEQRQLRLQSDSITIDSQINDELESLKQEVGEGAADYTVKAQKIINDYEQKALKTYSRDDQQFLQPLRMKSRVDMLGRAKQYEIEEGASYAKNNAQKIVARNLEAISIDRQSYIDAVERSHVTIDTLQTVPFESRRAMKSEVERQAYDLWHKRQSEASPESYIERYKPTQKINIDPTIKFTEVSNVPYSGLINSLSRKYGVDPQLISAVMHQESAGKKDAVSHKGATGLMQLMPETAKELGVKNIKDPKQNIDGGIRYLKQQLDKYDGDVSLALAAYNAGPGAVDKHGGIPPFKETKDYVSKITKAYFSQYPEIQGERRDEVEHKYYKQALQSKTKADAERQSQINDKMSALIQNGSLTSKNVQDMWDSGQIDDKTYTKQIKAAKSFEKKQQDTIKRYKDFTTAQTFHPDFKKSVDYVFNEQILPAFSEAETAEERATIAVKFIDSARGVVPKQLNEMMTRMAKTNVPAAGEMVGNFVTQLKYSNQPEAISEIPDNVRNFGEVYEMHIMSGMPPQEASRLAYEANNPDNLRIQQMNTMFDDELKDKNIKEHDILSEYGGQSSSLFGFIGEDYSDQDKMEPQFAEMQDEFARRMRDNFIRNGGDMDKAAEMASEQIGRTWSRTFNGQFMQYAPEAIYGLTSDEVQLDLQKVMLEGGVKDFDSDDYHLLSTPQTARAVKSGNKEQAEYMLMKDNMPVKDENQNPIYYRVDVEGIRGRKQILESLAQYKEEKEAREFIQRQSEKMNLPPEIIAKMLRMPTFGDRMREIGLNVQNFFTGDE